MGWLTKRPNGKWRAGYRLDGKQHSREGFIRKVDAQTWLDEQTAARLAGTLTDPKASNVSIESWAQIWLSGQVQLKPTSRTRTEGVLRVQVLPRWGRTKLKDVSHAAIQAWVGELTASGLSASSVRRAHGVLAQMLELAVKDRRLTTNLARGITLAKPTAKPAVFLTAEQVEQLATACANQALVVRFLAYTGLRWGEMAALQVRDINPLRRRVHVSRSVTEDRGHLVFGTTKTGRERTVPLPRFLLDDLAEALSGKEPHSLVFQSSKGGVLRNRNFVQRTFAPATRAAGVPGLTPHGLRHTAASLAISAGANVKVVQQMLGHETATMTLDRYGHLFPDQLDDVADRLDAIHANAAERLLSEEPARLLVVKDGEPLTCDDEESRLWESNPRPTHYECVALAD